MWPQAHRALGRQTIRLFGLRSTDQRLLFDPAYKYDGVFAPAQRCGDLFRRHLQRAFATTRSPMTVDLRVGWFAGSSYAARSRRPRRRVARSELDAPLPGRGSGARRDTAGAMARFRAHPATVQRAYAWGAAFFLSGGSRGDHLEPVPGVAHQLDVTGGGRNADFYLGGEFAAQHVETFQRVKATPVGVSARPPCAATPRTSGRIAVPCTRRPSSASKTSGSRSGYATTSSTRAPTAGGAARRRRRAAQHQPTVACPRCSRCDVRASVGRFTSRLPVPGGCLLRRSLRTGRFRRATPTRLRAAVAVRVQPADAADRDHGVRSTSMSSGSTAVLRAAGLDPDSRSSATATSER